jgi:hypothetical protein
MPVITGIQGYTSLTQQTRLCLETGSAPGESLLLPLSAGAATLSLTTQPNAISPTTGMHLHFYIIGNPTAGTIVITGKKADNATSQTSITYHVPVAPQNAQGYSDFTTSEVWGSVNANGIALTSLTPCQVMVFGSFAGKFVVPITSDSEEKIAKFSPTDKRGILFKNLRVTQLTKSVDLSKFDAALYPDALWAYYMLISSTPTTTTIPATPTTKLASTVIAGTMTLTTGPTTPGEFLIFAITTNTASGTIVLSGTDNFGNAVSETITVSSAATQTVYSTKRYSALTSPGPNQFTTTGMTGAHIAVTGVFAWQYTWTWDGINNLTPYSAALEVFDGVMGVVLPGTILTDGTWDWQKEKEIAFTSKGMCQDFCIVGDSSPASTANYLSGINPFGTLAQPTSLPIVSWPASFYIDALPGTPGTTQDGTLLTFKFGITTGRMWKYAGDGQQRPSFVTWDSEPDFSIDATAVFQNYQYYNTYFKTNSKFALVAAFQGSLLGKDVSNTYYEQVQFTCPVKLDTYHVDYSKNVVEAAFKTLAEYDFLSLGYAYRVSVIAQVPPTYTA